MTESPQQLLATAAKQLNAGAYQDCLNTCRRLLEKESSNADALFLVARAAPLAGDPGLADRAFRFLLPLKPFREDHWLAYISFLRKYRKLEPAEQCARELVTLVPGSSQAWHRLGLCHFDQEHYEDALAAATQAHELAPARSEGWELAAAALQKAGDLSAAIERCRQGLGKAQRRARLHYALAQLLRQECEFSDAAKAYIAAEKEGFSAPDLYRNLAEALLDSGELGDAMAWARRGVERHKDHAGLHRTLARVRHSSDAPGDPLDSLRAAAEARRGDPALWQTLVELLKRLDREDEASRTLLQARELGCPDTPGILALEALDTHRQGRSQEALEQFDQLLDKTPDNTLVIHAFLELALKARDCERAGRLCERALQIDPFDQVALAYQGTVWRLLGDERESWLLDYDSMVVPVPVQAPQGQTRESFFGDIREILEALHVNQARPIEQSVRGGTQTNGFLFRLKHELLTRLEEQLRASIASAVQRFPADNEHPFWSRRHRSPTRDGLRFAGAWSVRLRGQGFHTNHIHPEGWVSSAFYVHLPPEVRRGDDESGYIQFGQPMKELGLDLSPQRVVKPEIGTLVLFPSYMWHGTVPFESAEPRITVAFDLLPEA
ncbi:MAG: putative 2OG-Fe(II) oxygenase [Pseudomonadota bacterium]